MASTGKPQVHMLVFPLMAHGHMLPMVDLAKIFASHGVQVTILTTPANAPLIRPSLELFNSSNISPPICLHLIPFPSGVAGLPQGCENRSFLPSENLFPRFISALSMLRQPFHDALAELRPDCVFTDYFMPWTCDLAAERGIPRLEFTGVGFFAECAFHSMKHLKRFEGLAADAETVVLPSLPDFIEMPRINLPDPSNLEEREPFTSVFAHAAEVQTKNFGLVMNSFYELEPHYVEHFRHTVVPKAWHVGPVALYKRDKAAMSKRGGDAALRCLDCNFTENQMREMAVGLEASEHPFIWAVSNAGEVWIPEGFEETIEGRGMLIRGWAPQLLILEHIAVGGFMMHCGWNSCIEGISAGLPMVTWPLFADQFFNERLLVDVLQIGVSVGANGNTVRAEEKKVVGASVVEAAVRRVMGGDEEAGERRRRVRELKKMAFRAVEEGGSSYNDIADLIRKLEEKATTTAA
ncbi:hypothetical protein HPP92_004494 [Vanilla planifolia]|uniref:Glycosyltransferase n=1 Tax=Vanilla planifolia TaxID=51239 RepID=A0A835RSC0_VANPL|nr:hypothetical protein HPP92_004494 [Vanilla planifolia]